MTQKRSPAISDVQAIEAIVSQYATGIVAGGRFDITFAAVPAGKLWVLTAISSYASAAFTSMDIRMNHAGELHITASPPIINWVGYWNGWLMIAEDDYFKIENRGAFNGSTYHVSIRGYQIALY